MMISTRGRYALRVMVDLAENEDGNRIALKDIAARQDISVKYLERIMSELTKANLLDGAHGKGGGYRLNRPPNEYTVGSVLRLTEGTLAPVACLENEHNKCDRAANCRTLPMWIELDHLISNYLEGVTVWDLAKNVSSGDYDI